MPYALLAAVVTAADEPTPRYTYDNLKPGPLALLVTVFLVVAVVLLVRSMTRQLRKVQFDDSGLSDAERARRSAEDGPGPAA